MVRHNCVKQVKMFGFCKPCKDYYDSIYEPKVETKSANESFKSSLETLLDDKSGSQKLAQLGESYLRARLRETSFAWQILPPQPIVEILQQKEIQRIYEVGSTNSYVIPGRMTTTVNGELVDEFGSILKGRAARYRRCGNSGVAYQYLHHLRSPHGEVARYCTESNRAVECTDGECGQGACPVCEFAR